jgi:hypothetical protein
MECRIIFMIILNVFMLGAFMLSVIILSVLMLNIVMLCFVAPSVCSRDSLKLVIKYKLVPVKLSQV